MASLGLVDWEGPRRFAGGRSYALVGNGALLEIAALRLAIDTLIERGMKLVSPPVMVKERAMIGTGFFPLGREEAYAIPADELFLIGTSEVPLVSMHATRRSTRIACHSSTRDLPVLPTRSRRPRQGHPRPLPCAPVHEGRTGDLLRPGRSRGRPAPRRAPRQRRGHPRQARDPYRVTLACTAEIGLGQTRKHEVESWMPGETPTARPIRARRWRLPDAPAARVVVSSVAYARRRDWTFMLLTLIVLGELLASLVVALTSSL